jgi:hypothetical protein
MTDTNLLRALHAHDAMESCCNAAIRRWDRTWARLGLGGRKAPYDDEEYEFLGGDQGTLRRRHYDKSLRLLWKAELEAPWAGCKDANPLERSLGEAANQALDSAQAKARREIASIGFRAKLDRLYRPEQKQALVNVLAMIGHGEAYAWLVSAELLGEVQSTGARAALTMQVFEEAKHFVVLRELILAFECEVPRLSAWEYLLLERSYKSRGLEKFFAMNVLVEGFALSLFGMLGELPGLEILRLFHLDEARHAALPINYLREFPLSRWERRNPLRRWRRLSLLLPALPILVQVERDLALLGIDSLEFGGALARKVIQTGERVGFEIAPGPRALRALLNGLFNAYRSASRGGHPWQDYLSAETSRGSALEVEADLYGPSAA